MSKIRAIIKRPDEKHGHVTYISNTLKNLQNTVGGPIETVPVGTSAVLICNEEGKIKGLPVNFRMGEPPFADIICGDVAVVGVDGEEFGDLQMDFSIWNELLGRWGNV